MGVNGKQVKKSKAEIATIDCSLITIEAANGNEFGFDTANKLGVEPQIETTEGKKLVVKGILRAQKKEQKTITGHKLTITDNVFNPELVLLLQGGEILYDPENPDEIVGYNPPVAGSSDKGEVFKLNAYTSQYDAAGNIVKYEKTTYPNCTGVPVAFESEDDAFRAPEYEIDSAPNTGEPPYQISYVKSLPKLVDEYALGKLDVVARAATDAGKIEVEVSPDKDVYTNKYVSAVFDTEPTASELPRYGEVVGSSYAMWDGKSEIAADSGKYVVVVECDANGKAMAAGTVVSNASA